MRGGIDEDVLVGVVELGGGDLAGSSGLFTAMEFGELGLSDGGVAGGRWWNQK